MATHRSGAGDPARTLELLWRKDMPSAGQRGPKPTLNVDAIIASAVELADGEGLEALTMRKLAERLSVGPMTLYTYVPGKAELVDLMLDQLYADMPRRAPEEAGWRARLEAVAHDNRALYERHAWMCDVATSRPPLGPGLMAKYEYELGALEGLGLDEVEMDAALTFVLGFVESSARSTSRARSASAETVQTEEAWWKAHEPLLARVMDPARYPLASRVGSAAGAAHGAAYSPEHAFGFGLQRVLDGLGALILSRQSRRPPTRTPR
ncbi:TetR/AcrR family transcriptional regulator [Myxococcus landrumensis]|uniref:TetR/AcrR family transcriptional regulator C-terminal domain-containing protein n=1 Tax=Myxococcus landrumensis TaxID=2813577 RepID=A0ABX7NHS3_9BACT|nr:TetR/AcrR family transcriptional regulator [Myxococcus landrumus]QSQ17140.1 TetR/AcrR family transcriptional regulator C-terminal domain-containing protein [Myxococcus landrumus]